MWEYYKKTFVLVQIVALLSSYFVYSKTNHAWAPPIAIFISMQVSAVFGAMWANRLRRKVLTAHHAWSVK
jgi:hypothetical protein